MRTETLKIEQLKGADYNPRVISERAYKGLKNTIKKYGLVQPIVINNDYTVIGGHQRLKACKELGIGEVQCVIVDLSKPDEKKLNLLLNSHAITGDFDNDKLSQILLEFKQDVEFEELLLSDLVPLDYDEMDKLEWKEMPEYINDDLQAKYKLIVNFDTLEAKLDFGNLVKQKVSEKTKFIWHPEKKKEVLKDKAWVN